MAGLIFYQCSENHWSGTARVIRSMNEVLVEMYTGGKQQCNINFTNFTMFGVSCRFCKT